ncbi:MAG: putative oxidoreductase [Psychromonas sp.]|jgi:putative oxidoreductase
MASIGFEPSQLIALMSGSAAFFGGIALIFGLLIRPAVVVTVYGDIG